MDDGSLNRLSMGISVLWLILCVVRMGMYSSFYMDTPQGRLFADAVNILLIVGIVFIAAMLLKRFFRFSAARTMKSTHCQQCYARIPDGQGFCPRCGCERPKGKQ